MKQIKRFLGGAILFDTPRYEDPRGSFSVLYEVEAAEAAGLGRYFLQDNCSLSTSAGTVRGLHLQLPPWEQGKLIRVLRGRVMDVFVDMRPGSETCGQYQSVELAAADDRQLFLPPGFAHGFCTLEPDTEVFYKVDAPYRPEAERTVAWDDPALAVDWPVDRDRVVLSDKDADGAPLADVLAEVAAAAAMAAAGSDGAAGGVDAAVETTGSGS